MDMELSTENIIKFMREKPHPMFPCLTKKKFRDFITKISTRGYKDGKIYNEEKFRRESPYTNWKSPAYTQLWENNFPDSYGRCGEKCANCNCKMIYNIMKKNNEELKNELKEIKECVGIETINNLKNKKIALNAAAIAAKVALLASQEITIKFMLF